MLAAESLTLLVSLAALVVVAAFAARVLAKLAKLVLVVAAGAWLWWAFVQYKPTLCRELEARAPASLVQPICR